MSFVWFSSESKIMRVKLILTKYCLPNNDWKSQSAEPQSAENNWDLFRPPSLFSSPLVLYDSLINLATLIQSLKVGSYWCEWPKRVEWQWVPRVSTQFIYNMHEITCRTVPRLCAQISCFLFLFVTSMPLSRSFPKRAQALCIPIGYRSWLTVWKTVISEVKGNWHSLNLCHWF